MTDPTLPHAEPESDNAIELKADAREDALEVAAGGPIENGSGDASESPLDVAAELNVSEPVVDDGIVPETTDLVPAVDLTGLKNILEAALLVAGEPVPVSQLSKLFEPPLEPDTVRKLLDDLRADWTDRAVELVQVASGWRFQGKAAIQQNLDRLTPEKPPRYSRAVMETLAIIAYQQPVTRGDIEAIRGVAVSTNVIKTLEDRSWVEIVGHRETPGRPALYATTKTLLDDLGLRSLSELPPLAELDASHLLETPDAPTKAAEARLALASPILAPPADESATAAEPGAATDRGDGAGSPQVVD